MWKLLFIFFQLQLANHLFEAGLCCKMFAYLSGLFYFFFLMNCYIFQLPWLGAVSILFQESRTSLLVPATAFQVWSWKFLWPSRYCSRDQSWNFEGFELLLIYGFCSCGPWWLFIKRLGTEKERSLTIPSFQLNRCAGSSDVCSLILKFQRH